ARRAAHIQAGGERAGHRRGVPAAARRARLPGRRGGAGVAGVADRAVASAARRRAVSRDAPHPAVARPAMRRRAGRVGHALVALGDYLVLMAKQDRLLLEDVRQRREEVEANQQRIPINLGEIQRTSKRTTAEGDRLDDLRRERESSVLAIQTQRKNYEAAAA